MLFKSDSICTVNKCLRICVIFVIDVTVIIPEYDFVLQILEEFFNKLINRCEARVLYTPGIFKCVFFGLKGSRVFLFNTFYAMDVFMQEIDSSRIINRFVSSSVD